MCKFFPFLTGKMHMFEKSLEVRALYRDARAFKFFVIQKTLLKWFSILLQNKNITSIVGVRLWRKLCIENKKLFMPKFSKQSYVPSSVAKREK